LANRESSIHDDHDDSADIYHHRAYSLSSHMAAQQALGLSPDWRGQRDYFNYRALVLVRTLGALVPHVIREMNRTKKS
jgi:hypothetical protein